MIVIPGRRTTTTPSQQTHEDQAFGLAPCRTQSRAYGAFQPAERVHDGYPLRLGGCVRLLLTQDRIVTICFQFPPPTSFLLLNVERMPSLYPSYPLLIHSSRRLSPLSQVAITAPSQFKGWSFCGSLSPFEHTLWYMPACLAHIHDKLRQCVYVVDGSDSPVL